MSNDTNQLLPYSTIIAAAAGDTDALITVRDHYRPYIRQLARRPFFDEYGSCYVFSDDTMARQLEAKLISGVLKFSAV